MSDSKELLINFAVNCAIAGFTMWAGYRLIDKLDPTREVYFFFSYQFIGKTKI